MSTRIRVLDEGVINRIAAGEVIDRPFSVVKELVENSIDAKSTAIRVDIERGGKKLIRVRDNGTGMSHDDAFLALERHATSKLTSEKDLISIATMGFRGEALASIASVSRLRLITCDESDEPGTELLVEGGVLRKAERIGSGRGTLVEVANLFYNVPVRLKFLKENRWESDLIDELITRFALAFPHLGFTYSQDGRLKLDAPPVKSSIERVHTVYSREVRDNLVAIDYAFKDVRVHGHVAKPPYVKSNMRSVFTFVNGRSVRDRLVNSAVMRAFSNLMERGRYPLAILFLEMPPEQVDVNVHPQKAEVRFRKPKVVSDAILNGVHEALMGAPFNPQPIFREPIIPERPYIPIPERKEDPPRERETLVPSRFEAVPLPPAKPSEPEPAALTYAEPGRYASMGVLGQLPGSFLVLHTREELVILDHHAAHERVLFDRLLAIERESVSSECQGLLIPKVLEYSRVEFRALIAHVNLLRRTGFAVEEFGDKEIIVKGVPPWFREADVEDLFASLIEVMLDTGLRGDPTRLNEELLKNIACKAAVKEPSEMHPSEIRALLASLDASSSADVCPHGRPLTVRYPLSEIRKKMGRK
ncbi:DNA mismatch repair endonuclease MutL [Desulfomonile tiedjei]|uniref:DNA mismatch repair protein MutL n=1 Tax=Desulfomonile tiedjei (strain ATCC 49306 / DSM 6799 / DCB-1) TaxID=706587 RepID=I4C3I5_DESTA|nr:DNA mismatch repair endonuclease MutL [Desulfomonile tiedjei]AFM24126.1 DNA mismatch repair protein MutL [Desulfomonile tiedjei DSM 6799]